VPIVGGDIAHHRGGIVATLALVGEAAPGRVVTRSGARIGDWIYRHGRARPQPATRHHYRFAPAASRGAWLARQRGVRAMMDVSDASRRTRRAHPPRRAARRRAAALPRRPAPASAPAHRRRGLRTGLRARGPRRRAKFARAWRRAFPRTPLTCIGRFVTRGALPPGALNSTTIVVSSI